MKGIQRFLNGFFTAVIILSLTLSPLFSTPRVLAAPSSAPLPQTSNDAQPVTNLNALILVNSTSAYYLDFQHYLQNYLDHLGVPYNLLDIATMPVESGVSDYALIVSGHRQLDIGNIYLDTAEQGYISAAVNGGTGLVSFDNDLSSASVGRYAFIQDVFGFSYGGVTSGSGVNFPSGTLHYIAERHSSGESLGTGGMSLPGVTLPGDVTTVASTGTQPFIAVTTYGAGRAVQWGSYEWMSTAVRGPVYGLDDLLWRSLVWAARKPFVMQGMPPFLTMRVDDEAGGFEWIHIANEFGMKPWAGLFIDSIDDTEAADLSALTNAGLATTAIHAYGGSFFYFNHGAGDYPDSTVATNFATGTAWHAARNIPISDYILPHYYEFGSNVFQGLSDWGVEFVGTQQDPGQGYGAPWIMNGPFRKYETGGSSAGLPMYYGDFMTIPGHPEFNGQFFNCVTEIRDDAGYEWYPNLGDVAGTIGRGTRQTKRALDGMELATLFTHGYYVSGSWNASAPANWRAILQGITDNLSDYEPINVTMDYACRYIRATTTSNITSTSFDPATNNVTANFSGVTDIPTRFYLFMDGEGFVMVDVPTFNGTTTVNYTIPGPLDHILVSPNPASVVAGTSQQFSAEGYDSSNNPIPNLTFAWSVTNGGGTVDVNGRFTAGVTPGTYIDTITATRNAISGTATVVVTEPVLHHFEFASITSPKYLNSPFSVTIRARDDAGNQVVGYAGTVTLTDSTGTIAPVSAGPFTGGAWTGQVTIGAAEEDVTLTATGSGVTGTSNAFQVLAAPTCPCSIWDSATAPVNTFNADAQAVELGVKFRAATDGYISALRFYRGASNPGTTFTGHLWTAGGVLLAEAVFPAGTPAGWQQVSLSTPVPITADTTYIVSYHTTTGYAADRPYFIEANRALFEWPPLRALVDGEQGGNGIYKYGPSGTFPTDTYQSSNYWVDVVFETAAPADTTPPTVTATSPASSATGVDINTNVTITFSEPMDDTSINTTNIELRDPGNVLVPASVTYDPVTQTAQLNPDASLAYSTIYQVTVKGLPYGVMDLAGNTMLVDYTWSFTTASAPPTLHHFNIATIANPQTTGVPFPITVTASDINNNTFTGYAGQAALSVSAGTLLPLQTGAFVNGVWTGLVTVTSDVILTGITITAADGIVTGQSNGFDIQLLQPVPFYSVTSASYEQEEDMPFEVVVTAYPGATINLWEDNHQNPILTTFSDPLLLNDHDGQWDEFWYQTGRPFPALLAGHNEWENNSLAPIHFFATDIPNGSYQVWADLYTANQTRYYYGYTEAEALTSARWMDNVAGAGGTDQFEEYLLGTITIANGRFDLWAGDGDPGGVTYLYGWAHIRLAPVSSDPIINLWEDTHQDPVLTTTLDPAQLIETDGKWTEFSYPTSRPYPAIFAAVNEENYGLPVMHYYASGLANGTYEVMANLYDNAPLRYYYGYSSASPKSLSVDLPGCYTGTQFREYSLGTVTVTDGNFDLYVQDADLRTGTGCGNTYPFFGWAWIRLVSTGLTMSSTSPTMLFDGDGDGVYGEPGDEIKQLVGGVFSIMALDTLPGTDVLIHATDSDGRFGFNTYTILPSNYPPVLDPIGNQTVEELSLLSFTATATDPDLPEDTLTFSLVGAPAGASITSGGLFSWTPTEAQGPADHTFDVCVSDGALDDCETLTVSVTEGMTVTFNSLGAYDGQIIEGSETSDTGKIANAVASNLLVGDHALDRQVRSILHFNTSSLPDNAVITSITIKIKRQMRFGTPFASLGNLQVDIANPFFGAEIGIKPSDFQAVPSLPNVGAFNPAPDGNWYSATLDPAAYPLINLTGGTQFRLAFSIPDDDDGRADWLMFYSGNFRITAYQPVLIITYYIP